MMSPFLIAISLFAILPIIIVGLDQNYKGLSTECIVEACLDFLEKRDPNGNCEAEEHVLFNVCCPDDVRKNWINRFVKMEKSGQFVEIEGFDRCIWGRPVHTTTSMVPTITAQSTTSNSIIVTTVSNIEDDNENDFDDEPSKVSEPNKTLNKTCSDKTNDNITLIQLIAIMAPAQEQFPMTSFLIHGGFLVFEFASVAHFSAGLYFSTKFWKHVKSRSWIAAFWHGLASCFLTFGGSVLVVLALKLRHYLASHNRVAAVTDEESPDCGDQDLQNLRDALELISVAPAGASRSNAIASSNLPINGAEGNTEVVSDVTDNNASETNPTSSTGEAIVAATDPSVTNVSQDDNKVDVNIPARGQLSEDVSPTAPPPPYPRSSVPEKDNRVAFDLSPSYSSTYMNRVPSSHSMGNWTDIPGTPDQGSSFMTQPGPRGRRRTISLSSSNAGQRRKAKRKRRRTQYVDPSLFLDREVFTDARSNPEQKSSEDESACRIYPSLPRK